MPASALLRGALQAVVPRGDLNEPSNGPAQSCRKSRLQRTMRFEAQHAAWARPDPAVFVVVIVVQRIATVATAGFFIDITFSYDRRSFQALVAV